MKAAAVARVLGIVFAVAGIAGFVPWIAPPAPSDAPVVTLDVANRMLGGVFAVNAAHDAVHVLFGILGIAMSRRTRSAVAYCRIVVWTYAVLLVAGAIPLTNTLFGIAPVYGWDIALHAVILAAAAYGGYGPPSRTEEPAAT